MKQRGVHGEAVVMAVAGVILAYGVMTGLVLGRQLNKPTDWDSVHYHIPIAQQFVKNLNLVPEAYPLNYYPAWAHVPLVPFTLLEKNIWLMNWFNVLTLLPLFGVSYVMAKAFGYPKHWAALFGAVVVSLVPVVRLRQTQIIDLWLLIYFVLLVIFLQYSPSRRNAYLSAVFGGLFLGSKYTAVPIFLVMLVWQWRRLTWYWKQYPGSMMVLFGLGAVWYLRNWRLTGNPVYPGGVSIGPVQWVGSPLVAELNRTTPLKGLLAGWSGLKQLVDGVVSELTVWGVAAIGYLFARDKEKSTRGAFWAGVAICLLYLVIPAHLNNIFHDMRYVLPGLVLIILALMKYLYQNSVGVLVILLTGHFLAMAAMVNYYPKALLLAVGIGLIALRVFTKDSPWR